MTIDELQAQEDENKRIAYDRKNYLKQKDWFVIMVPAPFLENRRQKGIVRLSELESTLDSYDVEGYKGTIEIVRRTNQWAENLPEAD